MILWKGNRHHRRSQRLIYKMKEISAQKQEADKSSSVILHEDGVCADAMHRSAVDSGVTTSIRDDVY